jgi:hypothetical protein
LFQLCLLYFYFVLEVESSLLRDSKELFEITDLLSPKQEDVSLGTFSGILGQNELQPETLESSSVSSDNAGKSQAFCFCRIIYTG